MTNEVFARAPRSGAVLTEWQPENPQFWERTGKRIATRNLWISIPCLLLAFSVWVVWSAVTVRLNSVGFHFTVDQLFWLAALPGLSGPVLRAFYSFMVPVFGGRRWTALSTLSLAVPAVWMGFAVQDPATPYSTFLIIALLCGLGAGNFASSMANISFFYPRSQQGTALGLNAGLGNLGVSASQWVVPQVITFAAFGAFGGPGQLRANGSQLWLQNGGFIWVPFIVLFTVIAWVGMNDIASAKASFRDQAVIFRRKHNWIMCWLYVATFGSFIGYSAGFPLLISNLFPAVDPLKYAFLGPLVGALARPVGGVLADKLGGARVTIWNFVLMIGAVLGVLYFMPHGAEVTLLPHAAGAGSFPAFLILFMALFITTGIGNGSTFRMIPIIFRTEWERRTAGQGRAAQDDAMREARKESAAVLGFSSAVGAIGAFFIPKAYGTSLTMTGAPDAALYVFIAYYVTCIMATWWWYYRSHAEVSC